MTPAELSRTVLHAVRRAVDEGELSVTVPERVVVTAPGPGGCGDYATNIALQLARPAGRPPLGVAGILRARLLDDPGPGSAIHDVVVTPPGFLNIRLRDTAPTALVEEILHRGTRYGHADDAGGEVHRLHCPREVRALVVADTVGRLLRAQGAADVRTSCDGAPDARWTDVLGLPPALHQGRSAARQGTVIRPVPAPADPTPLGRDAGRWALLHPAPHDRPRIGDEHLEQREGNPLFRVRYAHARTRALLRNAADLGFMCLAGPVPDSAALLSALADHPRVLGAAARGHAPDRLARHLVVVADAVLPLLPAVLPVGGEKPSAAHRARLALAEAAGTVLAGGLSLLGIDAPDHL